MFFAETELEKELYEKEVYLERLIIRLGEVLGSDSQYWWQIRQINAYLKSKKCTLNDEATERHLNAVVHFINYICKIKINTEPKVADLCIYADVLEGHYYFEEQYMFPRINAFNPNRERAAKLLAEKRMVAATEYYQHCKKTNHLFKQYNLLEKLGLEDHRILSKAMLKAGRRDLNSYAEAFEYLVAEDCLEVLNVLLDQVNETKKHYIEKFVKEFEDIISA